ncbi:MAG: hypothetical protein M1561_02355 [Gammaproteobacteria bacterium]|nr:hypothetical protein [Gammaproteobacteria bacterium]
MANISDANLQKLAKCCDDTSTQLNDLKDKLSKFIEIKQKAPHDLMFREGQTALAAIANLQKIQTILPQAIDEVTQLCNYAQQLLAKQAVSRPTLGMSSAQQTEEEDDNSGSSKMGG